MVDINEIKEYCLKKHRAYEDFPFGDIPICYKLNGKIFAQLYPNTNDFKITLKCTYDDGQFYRAVFPEKVVRGYHCPPDMVGDFWIAGFVLVLFGNISACEIKRTFEERYSKRKRYAL